MPTATVRLRGPDGKEHVAPAVGTGPVDATFQAIDAIIQAPNTLVEYSVHSITAGIDALGEVTVRISRENGDKRTFGGHGADTDIITASAKAYMAALNRMLAVTGGTHGQPEGEAATIATPVSA